MPQLSGYHWATNEREVPPKGLLETAHELDLTGEERLGSHWGL